MSFTRQLDESQDSSQVFYCWCVFERKEIEDCGFTENIDSPVLTHYKFEILDNSVKKGHGNDLGGFHTGSFCSGSNLSVIIPSAHAELIWYCLILLNPDAFAGASYLITIYTITITFMDNTNVTWHIFVAIICNKTPHLFCETVQLNSSI